jgi:hypothetical protein
LDNIVIMSDIHSKIIAAAAKEELAAIGFQRQGRSRLWIADRGFWLNVVEFTPDRWTKGVTLTNAAHWLWAGAGFMSFNECLRSGGHAEFETEEQFCDAMKGIAQTAAASAREIEERFFSFEAIAGFCVEQAKSSPDRMGPSWWGYEAGLSSGLIGNFDDAAYFLESVTDDRVTAKAAVFLALVSQPEAFRRKANDVVAQQRAVLKLKPLADPSFQ